MPSEAPGLPPEMTVLKATRVAAPPAWAITQRELMGLMEEAAPMTVEKYSERGGALYWADCVDDFYEVYYNWGLFYAMGADERVLDLALRGWNSITRYCDDSVFHRARHNAFYHGHNRREWAPQLHNEYFNLATQSGAGSAEWHHLGEANLAFYNFGLADPTISENVRRARKFAAMYMDEDPDAQNYDPRHKVFRSPIQTSEGPCVDGTVDRAVWWLQGVVNGKPQGPMGAMGRRATLYPVVKDLEVDWYEDPQRRDEIVALFEKVVLRGDTPQSLAATALITNAYMYTGEEKYRRWVLDYAAAWIERIRANGGIVPDNVGPTGKTGEHRDGQWWGGPYGWSSRGYSNIFNSLAVGAECALLLSGDFGYLELLRSQLTLLLDNAITREDGQLLVPTKHGPDGWTEHAPFTRGYFAHLYHASMSKEDRDLAAVIRDGDVETGSDPTWQTRRSNVAYREEARLAYYEGRGPRWPEQVMEAELAAALSSFHAIRSEDRDVEALIADNQAPVNPVHTGGLTQVMLGAPDIIYNGGLVRGTVRYFDRDRTRPGLPQDVAALVDRVAADGVGLQLVNLSHTETRRVIVEAGAFGEHEFTEVKFNQDGEEAITIAAVHGKYLAFELPPSTQLRVDAGMRRFASSPSYALPWHGATIPVPFQ